MSLRTCVFFMLAAMRIRDVTCEGPCTNLHIYIQSGSSGGWNLHFLSLNMAGCMPAAGPLGVYRHRQTDRACVWVSLVD